MGSKVTIYFTFTSAGNLKNSKDHHCNEIMETKSMETKKDQGDYCIIETGRDSSDQGDHYSSRKGLLEALETDRNSRDQRDSLREWKLALKSPRRSLQ